MKNDFRQKGFTYVELAAIMAVAGLMIGAVLQGQAMIDDTRQKRLINDLQGITSAYHSYIDMYNAVPGDDPDGSRWAGVPKGDGNGRIDGDELIPDGESQQAWQALRFAGLLSGDPHSAGTASLPRHPYGGYYGIGVLTFTRGTGVRNRVIVADLPADAAEMVDIKLDDGVYNTGTVQSSGAYASGTVVNLSCAL